MLKIAVIGTGAMGRNHLRVLADLPDLELIAAVDQDESRLPDLARRFGVATYADHRALLARAQPDCAVVAVPTRQHFEVCGDMIAAGVHTLVEKPIAASVEQGATLARAATQAGVLLAVGHIERFNPAVIELKRRLEAGELGRIFQAHVRRLGPFPERVRDVGVVLDLATHDLDVLRYLIGSEVIRVYAETERQIHTAHEDLVNGLLRFASGVIASLDINWLTPTKVRTLALTGERGMFVVDYLRQDLTFFANDYVSTQWETMQMVSGVSEGSVTRFNVEKREPLRVELERFTEAVRRYRERRGPGVPLGVVTAEDGLEALRLATLVVQSGQSGTAIDGRPSGDMAQISPVVAQ
ncbi:MAG TPA: Gfo/Idh/MocA family oxidoreductase [Chloroflexota bacterium]|nr:Gfo/Idh/MocA family oxidoreductase [Chloroflexota bacterium]